VDYSQLPEPVRRRLAELDAMPPIETARGFVGAYVDDADSLEEVRMHMRNVAATTTRGLRRDLAALETMLAQPQPEGTLAQLVGWDGNWVLDDPSDRGAAAFLAELAEMLRTVIAEAESAQR
jgi:hypothetical protein